MRTVKSYDMLNRLTNIVSTTNGVGLNKFAYLYNSANQRTRATMVDGSYWLWGYDSLGQVTSAKRYWSDGTPVAGQQFEYAFDTIGNRITSRTGGDLYAANLRQADYGANFLNQYTNRSIPGFVEVQGSAHSNATVSVWGDNGSWSPTVRKGEYFRGELAVTNSSASVWLGFTNIAVLNTATNDIITNIVGHTFVPQRPEAFTHDLDGNLTGDGKWTYTWDAENRLIAMESVASVPNAAKKKLELGYDSMWRRTSKVVSTNLNGTDYPAYTNYFVYDGWNLIAVLGPQSTVLRAFIWGLDLSGSPQGAGGVGGLVFLSEIANGQISSSHAAAYDGNGNLTALLNASTRTESARCEFGPFGEVLRAAGTMATSNPFRFSRNTSMKTIPRTLALALFLAFLLPVSLRAYYSSEEGRWLSRDPIEERDGSSLYAAADNQLISDFDSLGLWTDEQMANRHEPSCRLRLPFEFSPTSAFKTWGEKYHNVGAISVQTTSDMLKIIEEKVKKYDENGDCCRGSCVSFIGFSLHGSLLSEGVVLSQDESEAFDALAELKIKKHREHGKPLPSDLEAKSKQNAKAIEFFNQLKPKMCKGAKISIIQCNVELPPDLPNSGVLKRRLREIFGPGKEIETFTGLCGYKNGGYPSPLP